jgi:peptidylglycine monooxygenase
MRRVELTVMLGLARYRVERPFGDLPADVGTVTDVACDARGHLLVLLRNDATTDPCWPAVVELAPDGRRIGAWGEDLVLDAHKLAIDQAGRIFIVDRDAHEVVICDARGRRIGGLGRRHVPCGPFNHPSDVAFSREGDIYVADGYGNSEIHRFMPDGAYLGSFGEPGTGSGQFTVPHAVAVLPDDRVVVADRDNDRLQVFTPEGHFIAAWHDHQKPMALWVDGHGQIHVTDQVPRLSLLAREGELLGRCKPMTGRAHGICGGPDGCLYIAECEPSRLTRLVPLR